MKGALMSIAGQLAAGGAPINVAGLTQFAGSLVGLVVVGSGVAILARTFGQRNFAAVAGSLAVLLIGLTVVGLSLTGKIDSVSNSLANLVFG
jgi:hypothetical protein